jgi:fucose permease
VVGRLASGRFVSQEGLSRLIISSAVIGVVASLGAWATGSTAGFFAIVFVAGLSIACFWPSIQSHAAATIPLDSTMLFILLSCAGIPGFGLTSWIMGLVAESYGLRTSLLVIPAELALLAVVMLVAGRSRTSRQG